MIHLKTCKKCGEVYDFKDCPFCRERKFNKKVWLDKLFYDVGKQQYDFYLCGTYIKDNEKKFTKWKRYSECVFPVDSNGTCEDWKTKNFYEQINQRQILPNEIVIDIEDKDIVNLMRVCKKLEKMGIMFSVYDTGSRGYHIHILTKEELTKEDKLMFVENFEADQMKIYDKTMIALENTPHWKTGNLKKEIQWKKK